MARTSFENRKRTVDALKNVAMTSARPRTQYVPIVIMWMVGTRITVVSSGVFAGRGRVQGYSILSSPSHQIKNYYN